MLFLQSLFLTPEKAAAEAENCKTDKYIDLINDGCVFEPIDFEVPGAAGRSTDFSK